MRDAFMAIDAGCFAGRKLDGMRINRAFALSREIHRFELVVVAAFQRIIRFQAEPFILRQLQAMCLEFFPRVDGPEYLAPCLFRVLHLAPSCQSTHAEHGNPHTWRARHYGS
jgi:hypothetical protein